MEYKGGRDANSIVDWVSRKSSLATKELKTAEEAKEFHDAHPVCALGFFKDAASKDAQVFKDVASDVDDISFALVSDEKLFAEYKLEKDAIVLFKKFDEGRVDYDQKVDSKSLSNWLYINSLALVNEFTQETAGKLFGGDIKSHHLLFISKQAENYPQVLRRFQAV